MTNLKFLSGEFPFDFWRFFVVVDFQSCDVRRAGKDSGLERVVVVHGHVGVVAKEDVSEVA